MKSNHIKIFSSTYLFVAWIVVFLFLLSYSIGCVFYMVKTQKFIPILFITCMLSIFCIIAIFVTKSSKQWIERYLITKKTIKVYSFFKNTKVYCYERHNKVFYGYMIVNFTPQWFIVISNRTMSRFELENLNKIKQTDDFIKIKYSKKRREQLMDILPQNMACQLRNPPPGKK